MSTVFVRGKQSEKLRAVITCNFKWYRKVAFDIMLNVNVVNTLSVYKTVTAKNCSIIAMKEEIVGNLVKKAPALDVGPTNTKSNHVLVPNKRARCPKCYKKVKELGHKEAQKNAKKTSTKCDQCGVPMCQQCFNQEHTRTVSKQK